jgi:hypothetical protein
LPEGKPLSYSQFQAKSRVQAPHGDHWRYRPLIPLISNYLTD